MRTSPYLDSEPIRPPIFGHLFFRCPWRRRIRGQDRHRIWRKCIETHRNPSRIPHLSGVLLEY